MLFRSASHQQWVHALVCWWMVLRGQTPAGTLACHTCSRPSCLNRSHLRMGSHRLNAADRLAKGKSPRKVRGHGWSTLGAEEAPSQAVNNATADRSAAKRAGLRSRPL